MNGVGVIGEAGEELRIARWIEFLETGKVLRVKFPKSLAL
jgi:hypothetical protein